MILKIPDYYGEFACLAGSCKHSCCVGWEVDIDEDTWDYYDTVGGPFGDRLRSLKMVLEEEGEEDRCFRLTEEGRCPFLDGDGLCEIIRELGEEALCEVCTEYPRFTVEYGDTREKCLSISCEEVGRILFSRETPVAFPEKEIPGHREFLEEFDPEEDEEGEYDEEPGEERILLLQQARDQVIRLLQDRTRTVDQRLARALEEALRVQEILNREDDLAEEGISEEEKGEEFPSEQSRFSARCAAYQEMELLDEEWETLFAETREVIGRLTEEEYRKGLHTLLDQPEREREYEQLLVYAVFRYGMKSVYDGRFYDRIRLAAAFYLMMRDLDLARLLVRGSFTLEDRVDLARIFSRQVEHSEDNVDLLMDSFLFDPVWSGKNLNASFLI